MRLFTVSRFDESEQGEMREISKSAPSKTPIDFYQVLTRWCVFFVGPPIAGIAALVGSVLGISLLYAISFLITGLDITRWIGDSWTMDAIPLFLIIPAFLDLFHCIAVIPCGMYQVLRKKAPRLPMKSLFVIGADGILALRLASCHAGACSPTR